jgi:hypothetical protein
MFSINKISRFALWERELALLHAEHADGKKKSGLDSL